MYAVFGPIAGIDCSIFRFALLRRPSNLALCFSWFFIFQLSLTSKGCLNSPSLHAPLPVTADVTFSLRRTLLRIALYIDNNIHSLAQYRFTSLVLHLVSSFILPRWLNSNWRRRHKSRLSKRPIQLWRHHGSSSRRTFGTPSFAFRHIWKNVWRIITLFRSKEADYARTIGIYT